MDTFLEHVKPWRRRFGFDAKQKTMVAPVSCSAALSADLEQASAAVAKLSLSKQQAAESVPSSTAASADLKQTAAVTKLLPSDLEATKSDSSADARSEAPLRPKLIRDSLRSLDKIIQKRLGLNQPLRVYVSVDYSLKVPGACETKLLSDWSNFLDICFAPPSDADLIVVYGDFHDSDRAEAFSNVQDCQPFTEDIGDDARCMADSLFVLIENAEPNRGDNVALHWYTYQT